MSHNFIIIILILGLIIGMFIKILNSPTQNNMLSSIKNAFQSPVEVKYITYNPNLFLKPLSITNLNNSKLKRLDIAFIFVIINAVIRIKNIIDISFLIFWLLKMFKI